MTKASQLGASFAVKQLEHLGFVKVEVGPRRINVFMLIDEWKSLNAVEAARRMALARSEAAASEQQASLDQEKGPVFRSL